MRAASRILASSAFALGTTVLLTGPTSAVGATLAPDCAIGTVAASAHSSGLTPAQVRFVRSSAPKEVWMDRGTKRVAAIENLRTGTFTLIKGASKSAQRVAVRERVRVSHLQALITERSPCQTGDVCLNPSAFPYSNFGFTGKGSKTGSYGHVISFDSNSWETEVDTSTSGCTQYVGPHTHVGYGSVQTVVEVNISGT